MGRGKTFEEIKTENFKKMMKSITHRSEKFNNNKKLKKHEESYTKEYHKLLKTGNKKKKIFK